MTWHEATTWIGCPALIFHGHGLWFFHFGCQKKVASARSGPRFPSVVGTASHELQL